MVLQPQATKKEVSQTAEGLVRVLRDCEVLERLGVPNRTGKNCSRRSFGWTLCCSPERQIKGGSAIPYHPDPEVTGTSGTFSSIPRRPL